MEVVLVYNLNASWIAGAYYIEHIVKACQMLSEDKQPKITFLYNNAEALERLRALNYTKSKFVKISFPVRLINKFSFELFKKIAYSGHYRNIKNTKVYPYLDSIGLNNSNHKIYWIPDLQDRYFPELFSEVELKRRSNLYKHLSNENKEIAFSSQNAANDFNKFYPNNKCKIHILKFASLIPAFQDLDLQALKKKFDVTKKYFIVCNQFWKHKNHMLSLQAINELKSEVPDFQVIYTGKWNSKPTIQHYNKLDEYIKSNGLEDYVKILGFIDRREQLKLLEGSISVIQPSLFEGWSTVVEDAKAIGKHIIVSDIPLHREQISKNCTFFDPKDPMALAKKMLDVMNHIPPIVEIDYDKNIKHFAEDFLKMIS